MWPHVEERVLDEIQSHRSTIVFANSRRLAERLCARLNELAAERAEEHDGTPPSPVPGRAPVHSPAAMMALPGAAGGGPPHGAPAPPRPAAPRGRRRRAEG